MNKLIDSSSIGEWESIIKIINKYKKTDIYFNYEYIKCFHKSDSMIKAYVYKENEKILFMPFIQKKIPNQNKYYDFETIYGYSGPLFNNNDKKFKEKAFSKFLDILNKNNIIAGLIRFHPFLNNHLNLSNDKKIKILSEKQIVYLDQTKHKVKISKNAQRNIKKSKKYNLKFINNKNYENIYSFFNLYDSLMKKKNTSEMYKFDMKYFINLFKNNNNIFIILASLNENILGGIIYSIQFKYLNILLSATNPIGLKKGVAYTLRNKIISQNKDKLINFGGGVTSAKDDSLFQYKKNFSDKTKNYYIGKVIVNERLYNSFINKWNINNFNSKFNNYHLRYRY